MLLVNPSGIYARKPSNLSHVASARLSLQPKLMVSSVIRELEMPPLSQVSSRLSARLDYSGFVDNYHISRVETRNSLASDLSTQSQYKISLELSPKEIALLRYTWNKMLVEDVEEEKPLALPLPGLMWLQAKEKPVVTSRQLFGATSTFCSQLYSNLLTMEPDLEVAFPSLRHQAVAMAGVLSLAVNSLDNLSCLDAYFAELGNRHSRILGIEPSQFELLGEAFVQTFHERFGTRFTQELEILWIKFYMYLANTLLQFGMDPALRLEREPASRSEYSELIYTTETNQNSMANSARRMSESTELSSILPNMNGMGARKFSATRIFQNPQREVVEVKEKKKKTRLGRKKGECTIM